MSIMPHAFSKMDPVTKALYRDRYKDFKRTVVAGFPIEYNRLNSVFIKLRKESNVTSDTGVLRF